MSTAQPIHELIQKVGSFDREACVAHLRQLRRPKIDFSEEFLHSQSLDRLRHIVMAALLQARKHANSGRKDITQ